MHRKIFYFKIKTERDNEEKKIEFIEALKNVIPILSEECECYIRRDKKIVRFNKYL